MFRFSLLAALVLAGLLLPVLLPETAAARPESTRTIKLRLLTGYQQAYGSPPQLLILGSSRGMRGDPDVLRGLLGVSGFNAGVGSGTPPDALAFLRVARALYPQQQFSVLWLLDVENMRLTGLSRYFTSVPQLVENLPSNAPKRASKERALAGEQLLSAANSVYPAFSDQHSHFAPNGYLIWCIYDYERARGITTASRLSFQLRRYRTVYPPDRHGGVSSQSRWYVREVVREINEMNVTPVIALTPYHPILLRMLKHHSWNGVHRRVLSYLHSLQKEYRLKVLDFTDVKSFGGWSGGFYDGVHSRPVQMRRLLRVVAERAGSYLKPGSQPVPSPTPTPTPTPTDPPTAPPTGSR